MKQFEQAGGYPLPPDPGFYLRAGPMMGGGRGGGSA